MSCFRGDRLTSVNISFLGERTVLQGEALGACRGDFEKSNFLGEWLTSLKIFLHGGGISLHGERRFLRGDRIFRRGEILSLRGDQSALRGEVADLVGE